MDDVIAALQDSSDPLFILHRHADRDSLGAAIGLREVIGQGTVYAPDGIASPAQSLADAVPGNIVHEQPKTTHDQSVVLDAPSSERIAPASPDSPVLIDHHEPADLSTIATAALIDTDADSTAELVERLSRAADWHMSPDVALPLLVGVLDDTGSLADGSLASVESATRLLNVLDERAADLPALLADSLKSGERIASAVGTVRATGYRAGDIVVAFSHVGAHESAAARSIRKAGVDLALVCSSQGDHVRVTARASTAFVERVNVGADFLPSLANELGGTGGGHDSAGVAKLQTPSTEAVNEQALALLESELGVTFGEIL